MHRYKYIHMEEMLGNVAGARQIFERWMKWEPDHNGWAAYIKVGGPDLALSACMQYMQTERMQPRCQRPTRVSATQCTQCTC